MLHISFSEDLYFAVPTDRNIIHSATIHATPSMQNTDNHAILTEMQSQLHRETGQASPCYNTQYREFLESDFYIDEYILHFNPNKIKNLSFHNLYVVNSINLSTRKIEIDLYLDLTDFYTAEEIVLLKLGI